MKLFRSKRNNILLAFLAGFVLFGGSAGTAYAAASSDPVLFKSDSVYSLCHYHQATSQNSAAVGKSGNGIHYLKSRVGGCTSSAATGQIGLAAFLKKTNGSACATNSAYYVSGQSITRYAAYSSTACGAGVQLQGSITSYRYNGSGYDSFSIAAPFQTY